MFDPSLETVEDNLTIPFEILHKFSLGFNRLEKDLLPLLNMEAVPSFAVPQEDPILQNPSNEVIAIIKKEWEKPQQILEDFKAFSYVMERQPSEIIEKFFPTDNKGNKINHNVMYLEREEISSKLKEYASARSVIQKLANDEVNCGLFQVRTHAAKELLVTTINGVIAKLLDRIKDMCIDNVKRIAGKYESILKELKVDPKNEEELFQLKKVVSENETEMQKIKNEVDAINRYMGMMEDYLYPIDNDLFDEFWELKSQPQVIKYEVMEANHTISDKDSKFSETLESEKDAFAKELILLEKQLDEIKGFAEYSSVSKCSTEVSLLEESIKKSREKIDSFNKR